MLQGSIKSIFKATWQRWYKVASRASWKLLREHVTSQGWIPGAYEWPRTCVSIWNSGMNLTAKMFIPHIFVWGFCFCSLTPGSLLPSFLPSFLLLRRLLRQRPLLSHNSSHTTHLTELSPPHSSHTPPCSTLNFANRHQLWRSNCSGPFATTAARTRISSGWSVWALPGQITITPVCTVLFSNFVRTLWEYHWYNTL